MKLSVAYNGDIHLLEELKNYKGVVNVFGSSKNSVTGGGRSSFILSDTDEKNIEESIKRAHENNIEFNYVMNSTCMGNSEYFEEKRKEILNQLDWLYEMKVDLVTLANPYVIDMCRKRHPNLKISLSSFVGIENYKRASIYDEMGVSEISVRDNINRNFDMLSKMSKKLKCDIQVIANQACLYQCPYHFYHANFVSHASQKDNESSKGQIDYSMLNCNLRRFSDKTEFIKSRWIRPEDIEIYEKIGINKFKITDRSCKTDWILNTVKAYNNRSYDGNLADLLYLFKGDNNRRRTEGNVDEKYLILQRHLNMLTLFDINIENKKLDGFLEKYKNSNCEINSCDECGYCKSIADKTISFVSEENVKKGLGLIKSVSKMLTT